MGNGGYLAYCDKCERFNQSEMAILNERINREMAEREMSQTPDNYRGGQPIGDHVITEIRGLIETRTQKEIREDAPPRLPNAEWRRGTDGWNLWVRIESTPGQDKHRYNGTLDYDRWQSLKASAGPARPIGFNARGMVPAEKPAPRPAAIPPGSGSRFNPPAVPPGPNPPVAGGLPDLSLISWEIDRDGGVECWYAPAGPKAARRTKTYLGRVGKRELKRLEMLPAAESRAEVLAKVREWSERKGIEYDEKADC